MTVIDIHTHMPGVHVTGITGLQQQEFLDLMDANGVDKAWVFTLDGLYFDPVPYNDLLLQFCSINPERLIPFCTIHPRYPNAVEELRRCVLDLGMRGLKLHPWTQAFSPNDAMMEPVGEALAELGIPVLFHDGTPPNSSPMQVAYFAMRHPTVPVILGHAGLHDLWKEAVYAAMRYPNIYLCPSGMPPYGIEYALKRVPIERFMFGSDAGFGHPYWLKSQLEKARTQNLSAAEEALFLGGNAERLLGKKI
jgi:predicted TIM-barrel fold metal-dependent hydrolase